MVLFCPSFIFKIVFLSFFGFVNLAFGFLFLWLFLWFSFYGVFFLSIMHLVFQFFVYFFKQVGKQSIFKYCSVLFVSLSIFLTSFSVSNTYHSDILLIRLKFVSVCLSFSISFVLFIFISV